MYDWMDFSLGYMNIFFCLHIGSAIKRRQLLHSTERRVHFCFRFRQELYVRLDDFYVTL